MDKGVHGISIEIYVDAQMLFILLKLGQLRWMSLVPCMRDICIQIFRLKTGKDCTICGT
jgi:hypothetical protein